MVSNLRCSNFLSLINQLPELVLVMLKQRSTLNWQIIERTLFYFRTFSTLPYIDILYKRHPKSLICWVFESLGNFKATFLWYGVRIPTSFPIQFEILDIKLQGDIKSIHFKIQPFSSFQYLKYPEAKQVDL